MDAAFEFFTMITGGLLYFKVDGIFSILTRAAPLICCGLSICFAYKAGMFNIGAAGQYVIGVFGSLFFALYVKAPWYVCILMAMFFLSDMLIIISSGKNVAATRRISTKREIK